MKTDIHPEYGEATITCACGEIIHTRATQPALRIEICSKCHPYFTGKQKIVDTAGRVERFERKYGEISEELERKQEEERGARIEAAKARAEHQVTEREERKLRLAERQLRKAERAAAMEDRQEETAEVEAVEEPTEPPEAEAASGGEVQPEEPQPADPPKEEAAAASEEAQPQEEPEPEKDS